MARPARCAPSVLRAASERAARLRRFLASRARKVSTKTLWAKRPACRACPESTRTSGTAARASFARLTTLWKTPLAANAGHARQDDSPSSKEVSRVARVVRARFLLLLTIPIFSLVRLACLDSSPKQETRYVLSAPGDYTRPSLAKRHAMLAKRVGGAHPLAQASARPARDAAPDATLLQKVRLIRARAMIVLRASRTISLVQTVAFFA